MQCLSVIGVLLLVCFVWSVLAAEKTYKDVHARMKSSADRLVHMGGKEALELPIDVDVILIGFDGHGGYQYSLDEDRLMDILQAHYETFRPNSRERGEPLSTEYFVEYNVVEVGSTSKQRRAQVVDVGNALADLEAAMHEKFVHVEQIKLPPSHLQEAIGMTLDAHQTYSIDATLVEPTLDTIVSKVLDSKVEFPGAPHWFNRNVVVVINPSKRRMVPAGVNVTELETAKNFELKDWDELKFDLKAVDKEESNYGYYWSYNGNGMSTTWLSKSSYVVIDVSAGPVRFGQEMAPSGAVSARSIPRIIDVLIEGVNPLAVHLPQTESNEFFKHVAEVRDTMFVGRLSAIVASAIRHLFLNDVWVDNTMDMKSVMIPIIVLRNHNDFNPIMPEDGHYINSTSIQEQLKILVVGQKAMVTESVHSLHQHKALAVALYKAFGARTEATVNPYGEDQPSYTRIKHYIDGDVLLDEFTMASDILSAALIDHEKFRGVMDLGPVTPSPSKRTIPVFVLSLKDVPFDVSFHNNELVVSNSKIVIVLQFVGAHDGHDIDVKYTGHFVGGEAVLMNTVDVERHIMAGVLTTLTGLPPPHERYDEWNGQVSNNWLWATGHTPYGPYSTCKTVSNVMKQAAHRNALVGRLEKIIQRLKILIGNLDDFAIEHTSMLVSDGTEINPTRSKTWADYLYKQSKSFEEPPIAKDVVKQLENTMDKLETALIELEDHFYEADFNKAEESLMVIGWKIGGISVEVHNALKRAKERLGCCQLEYKLENTSQKLATYIMIGVFLIAAIVVYCLIPAKDQSTGPILVR